MNPKRLVLAIVVVFVGIFATDFLIHGVWLKSDYTTTMSLWRPQSEMQQHMGWLMLGELLATVTFTLIYAKGFAGTACIRCAGLYGFFMGLFSQATTFSSYAVQPIPGSLAAKWIVAGIVQGVLMGLLVFFVYKPKPPAPEQGA
jgi:hypothetical protein